MNTVERQHSPVYRQLEAYNEVWKRDHAEAMACRDWEDVIAVGVSIFQMLREREESCASKSFAAPWSTPRTITATSCAVQRLAGHDGAVSDVCPARSRSSLREDRRRGAAASAGPRRRGGCANGSRARLRWRSGYGK